MTFKQAYKYAMENSEKFRNFDAKIKERIKVGDDSNPVAIIFSIGDQAFYYGYDGAVFRGKHTAKRSTYLINNDQTLVIE